MSNSNKPMRPDRPDRVPGMPAKQPEESFLQRWSRRKAKARALARKRQDDHTLVNAGEEREHIAKAAPTSAPASELPISKQEQPALPPIEQLNEDSDYSAFMSSDVSEELRRLALRKLFHSPKFNVVDPVDQFALDWNGFEPLGDVVTHEMRAALEREAQRAAEKLAAQARSREPAPDPGKSSMTTGSDGPPSNELPPTETAPSISDAEPQDTAGERRLDTSTPT